MDSNFYRVCVDRYINENFIITDCLCNLLSNANKARCEMIKFVDDVISIKSLKLEFEENDDTSISVFTVDGNGFKHYGSIYYVTEVVAKSNDEYRYRGYDVFKNQDKWFIRSDKSGVISYKSDLNEALIYIDCIIAIMKNIEVSNTRTEYINNENIISKYDDFVIFRYNNKYYYKESNSNEVKEVILVQCILLKIGKNISDDELLNPGFDFDVSGELFNNPYYCYWKFL